MTDQRDLLAREIDEELRREQFLKLWEQYGTYVVALVALIVAGIGAYKYYEHRTQVAAEAAGARLLAASKEIGANRPAEAKKILEEVAATGPAGYASLARLRLAGSPQPGKAEEAAAAYEAIAGARGVDPLLADYARLQAAMLRLDTASWTDMQNRLNDLVADANPFRFSARELLGLAAHRAGKTEEARREFQRLVGENGVPPAIGERARMMMAVLTEAELAKNAPPADAAKSAPKSGDTGGAAATDKKAK